MMMKRRAIAIAASSMVLAIAACAAPSAHDADATADDDAVASIESALTGSGLTAQYFDNVDFTSLKLARTEPVDFNWGTASPNALIGADTFSVRWTGQIDPVHASGDTLYQFYVTADDGVRLWVDGVLVIDHFQLAKSANAPVTWGGNAVLSGGVKHDLRLEYFEQTGNAQVKLEWASTGARLSRQVIPASRLSTPPSGLIARYYDQRDLTGFKFSSITSSSLSSGGASGTAIDSHLAPDNWSVRWTGQVQPDYNETYFFGVTSDDGVRLWIDNELVIDNWTEHAPTQVLSAPIALQAGRRYDIRLEYFQATAGWKIQLMWCGPSQTNNVPATIPLSKLYATPAADVIYGVSAMGLDRLPYYTGDRLTAGQSSYNRAGTGEDCTCKLLNPSCTCDSLPDANSYQYDQAGVHVLLDDRTGPGVVYRMWFTYARPQYDPNQVRRIQIYIDGDLTPRLDTTIANMTDGMHPPFVSPLVSNRDTPTGSGGFYVYVPIAYRKSIKIVSPDTNLYYDIEYQHLPAGTPVRSWVGTEEIDPAVWMWAARGVDPKNATGNIVTTTTKSLAAGQRTTYYDFSGDSNTLAAVRIKIPDLVSAASGSTTAADILDNTWIYMSWDGETTPSVAAPIGAFFAQGRFGYKFGQSVPAGIDGSGWLYVYLPMPFRAQASIELENKRASSTGNIQMDVSRKRFPDDFADIGYFRTKYTVHPTDDRAVINSDYVILDVSGAGKFVGLVNSYSALTHPPNAEHIPFRYYLEGDERVYIDGSRSPTIYGTGTEDLFDGGWYFDAGTFTASVAGNTEHTTPLGEGSQADNSSMYRFYLQNAIPFRTGIRYSIERLGTFGVYPDFAVWSLAYYYAQSAPRAVLTDKVDVGDFTSELLHVYQINSGTFFGPMTSDFEGDFDEDRITDYGRAHKGTSQFNLAIDAANQGVILRRLFDQGIYSQNATVFVDGAQVGTWYRGGGNLALRTDPNGAPLFTFRWREDDFLIPSRFTAGKSTIRVKVQYFGSTLDWNEFQYTAFSLL